MTYNVDEISEQICQLISEYAFPVEVLVDLNHRLVDCDNPHVVSRQLRYLNKIVQMGRAVKWDIP